jgi:D-proline reductase (dithiol) PrdB
VGLIAREIETRGIATLCMTSAYSITRSVNPPRAAFLDFPLGHTTGKADEPELQRDILRRALSAFQTLTTPGEIVELPFHWADTDAWKSPGGTAGGESSVDDNRTARVPTPQYQTDEDQRLADAALAAGGCDGCVWLD